MEGPWPLGLGVGLTPSFTSHGLGDLEQVAARVTVNIEVKYSVYVKEPRTRTASLALSGARPFDCYCLL